MSKVIINDRRIFMMLNMLYGAWQVDGTKPCFGIKVWQERKMSEIKHNLITECLKI